MPAEVNSSNTATGSKSNKRQRALDDSMETPKKMSKDDGDLITEQNSKALVSGSSSSSVYSRNSLISNFGVAYMPSGVWVEKIIRRVDDDRVISARVCTSFLQSGLSIRCHSMTKAIAITCFGVLRVKVLFKGEDISSGPPRISVREIDVEDFSAEDEDIPEIQSVYINTPWPCKIVEIAVIKRSWQFVTVCDVECYTSDIRSSSQSTPVSKGTGVGKMILKGVRASAGNR